MRDVAIVGVGQTPRTPDYLRKSDNMSWKDYIIEAVYEAIADCDKGLNPKDIQYMMLNYHGEAQIEAGGIGPVVADFLGLLPIGCTALCANCVGGGVGMHDAYAMIASGKYDRVLCVGFDKTWDLHNIGDKRAIGGDVEFDFQYGYDHPTLQAIHQIYDYQRYGKKRILKALALYRQQALWFSSRNPHAFNYKSKASIDLEKVYTAIDALPEDDNYIPEDFWNMFPPSALVDGAAAMILVPAEEAGAYSDHPIYLDAIEYKMNSHLMSHQMNYPVHGMSQYTMAEFAGCQLAFREAYKNAKIKVEDVDFMNCYEPHVSSLLPFVNATQITGGDDQKALDFILDGQTGFGGRLPVGTDGGRGLFGMTSGSNFGDCVYECVKQMRGLGGERQVKKADISIATGMQGQMASVVCAILRNSR